MKQQRVLILANNAGGLYLFRKETTLALLSDCEVYAALPKEPMAQTLSELGIKLEFVPVDRRGTNPLCDLKLLLRYLALLRKLKPCIVLTYTVKCNIYGGMACRLMRVPYLSTVTGLGTGLKCGGFLQRLTELLYRAGLKASKTVFFQNESVARFFEERRLARGETRLLADSGVNLEEHPESPYPSEEEGIRIVFLGRLMAEKGIGELLCAAEKLHEKYPKLSFHLAGMMEEAAWKEQIDRLVQKGAVVYHGCLSDVRPLIESSHASVMPSYHEGMCNALMESAAMARPLIASDVPGCRETVEDGKNGFLFQAHSAEAIEEAVERFLALSESQRAEMGKAGREKMEREFDRKKITQVYIAAVKSHCAQAKA